jgi:outer membrane protein assembly factor BamE (lipoprotein component of BamABCDE complex)
MSKPGTRILINLLLTVLVIHYSYANGYQKTVPCEEAVKNVSRIKTGMKESEVLGLLGSPKIITDSRWSYSFDCVKLPPKAGETLMTGLDIFFEGETVREIKLAWVDATGIRRPIKRNKPKRRKPARF